MAYPTILAVLSGLNIADLPYISTPAVFSQFSSCYVAILLYFVMLVVCLRRDLTIFMKITSYGSISITITSVFIIGVGILSLSNTAFSVSVAPSKGDLEVSMEKVLEPVRDIFLFNFNFTPLAGVLGIGYFLHPVSVPMMRNNRNQKNNIRDLSIGYFLVFISYVFIGSFGYLGFNGVYFSKYLLRA